ncbi:MAG: hypothetical protein V1694_02910 [Candidatus Eisenbacteria bacterium]
MKRRTILLTALVVLILLPPCVRSQEPVLDLAITELQCTCLPEGGVLLEALVGLATVGSIDAIYTDVRFYLDGQPAGSVVYDVAAVSGGECGGTPPDCSGLCTPTLINGEVIVPDCAVWHIVHYLEPDGPEFDICACNYFIVKADFEEGGSTGMTATAHVDDSGLVSEMDETNNSMTIFIGPSAVSNSTWGTIKALYR